MKILDAGCGNGGFAEYCEEDNRLSQRSWLEMYGGEGAYGFDINAKRIEEAKQRITNGTIFLIADVKDIPFEDNYFDIVHESGTFHHITNYDEAIKEISRVTKRKGVLLCSEVVSNDPIYHFARKLAGKWEGDDVCSYFTSDELIKKIENYYNIDSVKYYWRSLASDLITYFTVMDTKISMRACNIGSTVLKNIGLDKQICSHTVIKAVKK